MRSQISTRAEVLEEEETFGSFLQTTFRFDHRNGVCRSALIG